MKLGIEMQTKEYKNKKEQWNYVKKEKKKHQLKNVIYKELIGTRKTPEELSSLKEK